MSVLHSQIDTRSEVFQRNREAYDRQRAEIAVARDIALAARRRASGTSHAASFHPVSGSQRDLSRWAAVGTCRDW